jgi:hypothetical protein
MQKILTPWLAKWGYCEAGGETPVPEKDPLIYNVKSDPAVLTPFRRERPDRMEDGDVDGEEDGKFLAKLVVLVLVELVL